MIIASLALLFGVLAIIILWQFVSSRHYIQIGKGLAAHTVAFSRHLDHPKFRILFVGDSSAVGVGTSSPEHSIAGLTGKLYPEAEIVNVSVSGSKAHDVIAQLKNVTEQYNLIMVHVGGNDVVRFTPYKQLTTDVQEVLELAVSKGKHVLVTSTGNVGTAKLLPAFSRPLYTWRSRGVRAVLKHQVAASKGNVRYTDLFREQAKDPFALEPEKYYAADMFHPSDAGYEEWFVLITKELANFHL